MNPSRATTLFSVRGVGSGARVSQLPIPGGKRTAVNSASTVWSSVTVTLIGFGPTTAPSVIEMNSDCTPIEARSKRNAPDPSVSVVSSPPLERRSAAVIPASAAPVVSATVPTTAPARSRKRKSAEPVAPPSTLTDWGLDGPRRANRSGSRSRTS